LRRRRGTATSPFSSTGTGCLDARAAVAMLSEAQACGVTAVEEHEERNWQTPIDQVT
jgi:hypothetical protein